MSRHKQIELPGRGAQLAKQVVEEDAPIVPPATVAKLDVSLAVAVFHLFESFVEKLTLENVELSFESSEWNGRGEPQIADEYDALIIRNRMQIEDAQKRMEKIAKQVPL